MPSARETADLLVKYGAIPAIRYDNPDDGALAIDSLLRAGLPTVEVALNMPDATELIRAFSRKLERHQFIGAGTVWSEKDCEAALEAGAAYVASPGLAAGLGAMAHAGNAAYLPGALTPTEIAGCLRDGADIVKIFPATTFGQAHLKAMATVFADTRFCPAGGIKPDDMEQWFAAGARCVSIDNPFSAGAMRARVQKVLVEEARLVLDHLSLITR